VTLEEVEARAGCRARDEITDFLLTLPTSDLYRLLVHYSKEYDESFLLDFKDHIRREYPTDEEASDRDFGILSDMLYEERKETSV
jgi:6-pyruvoyl-tetrahydropterin synthase